VSRARAEPRAEGFAADDDSDAIRDWTQVLGGRAQLLADADRPSAYLLVIDRIRQSYVDLDDPSYLDFEYMQQFAYVLDSLPPGPVRITHIGGGALAFPRYVAFARPGSSQIVLEPDAALTDLVRARLPLPRRSGIRVRALDGRSGLCKLATGSADVVVLDAFAGGRVPADLTTTEFLADVVRVLGPDGTMLLNVADGPPMRYLRRLITTLGGHFPYTLAVADSSVLRGRRYGNVVLAGSARPLRTEVARAVARAPFPLRVLAGAQLRYFAGTPAVLTDTDAERSPAPPDAAWRIADE
jgi:spermidine synthase